MTMTKNAVGNLIARYKTVLQNCSLMNRFGSLAAAVVVAGAVVLGGASGAEAGTKDYNIGKGSITVDTAPTNTELDTQIIGGDLAYLAGTTEYVDGTKLEAETSYTISNNYTSTTVNVTAAATFDEIIGGNYGRNTAGTPDDNKYTIGDTSVTVGDAVKEVEYITGGSKSANSGGSFTTGDTSVVIGTKDGTTSLKVTGMVVGGSYAKSSDQYSQGDTTMVTGNTSLTINGGDFEGAVVAGSVAEVYEDNNTKSPNVKTTDDSTSLTITDGTFTDAVVGGAYATIETGATGSVSATVTDTATTTISGGTFNGNVVAGGYADGAGTKVTVGSTSLTIDGGTFGDNVIAGGYATNGGEATVGSTVLKISGTASEEDGVTTNTTTFADRVVGGGYATAGSTANVGTEGSEAEGYATYVSITGGKFEDNIVAGGYAYGRSASATANVYGDTYLEITGDIDMTGFKGDIVGGGEADGGTANVEGNTTVIIGSTVEGVQGNVYGGGMVNGNGTASEANVTGSTTVEISGEILESVIGGGRARSQYANAVANVGVDTEVIIANTASVNGVVGGGWAHDNVPATYTSTAEVGGSTYVTINGVVNKFSDATSGSIYLASGSTLSVAVVGGGVASGGTTDGTANATANVLGSTNITINDDAKITGDVVGGGMVYTSTSGSAGTATVTGDTNITINGGTITGDVYAGGYVQDGTDSSATATVTGTATLTILGGTFGVYDGDELEIASTLYGEQGTSATVGTAILNLGSDDIAYTGTFAGIKDFDVVNIYADSAITLTGASSFGSGSKLVMYDGATLTNSGTITTSAGAILDLSKTSGTITICDVTFDSATEDTYDSDGDLETIKSAWGYTGANYDGETGSYSTNSLLTSDLTTVTSVTYDSNVYTVVLGAASTDVIADALGSSTDSAAVSLVASAMDNAAANPAAASFILAAAEQDNGGTVVEGAAKLAATGAVVPGLGSVNAAAGSNMGARTTIAPQAKASAAADSSNWLAMNGDGAILPTADGGNMAQGFGIWFMPMYNHTSADGFKSGSNSYGYDTDIVGATLGADYTFAGDFRLGLAFNVGSGSSSSTGDFATTENDFDYVGISIYGAKHFDALGLSFDMGYTMSENDMVQDATGGDLYGTADAALFTIGAKAEYLIPLDSFNVTPYAGIRFNYYDVDAYDTKQNGDALFSTASGDNTVWEIPVGVTFDTTTKVGSWDITPSLGLGVKFAMGDLDADQEVSIAGVADSYVLSSEVADEITFQGALGLGFAKDACNVSLNYTLDLSENVESHGVSVNLRYEF